MKSSHYNELIELYKDRYAGYIAANNLDASLHMDDSTRDEYISKLKKMGYRCYLNAEGMVNPEFYRMAFEAAQIQDTYLFYCDEDVLNDSKRCKPFFKPDFSPETLESFYYIGGVILLKTPELSEEFFILADESDWSQLAKAIISKYDENPELFKRSHISKVLFTADAECSYSYSSEGAAALEKAEVTADNKISAIILSKDNVKMLLSGIDSIKKCADCQMEYIVVDNGSSDENRVVLEKELQARGVKYIYSPMPFIYSALCNIGAKAAQGDVLLFLNDDIEAYEGTHNFPSALLKKANEKKVGAVGARLLYPKGEDGIYRIQHIGITQLGSGPSHKLCTFDDSRIYERGRNRGQWNVMAVTGACLMVRRETFFEVGGFDERLHIAYTDVDLCLDLMDKGYRNVVVNTVALLHHESVSRGLDVKRQDSFKRLRKERETFYSKHLWLKEKGDPFYNISLSGSSLDYVPEVNLPWEQTELSKKVEGRFSYRELKQGKILYSIDRMDMNSSAAGDFYEVEGWCLMHGRNQLDYSPAVVLVKKDGSKMTFEASIKIREELETVFPKEKNVLLSGFICRIPIDEVESMRGLKIAAGMLKDSLLGKKCYYIMSDKEIAG